MTCNSFCWEQANGHYLWSGYIGWTRNNFPFKKIFKPTRIWRFSQYKKLFKIPLGCKTGQKYLLSNQFLFNLAPARLYSEKELFHWLLNSNNNWHFLTICYCMLVYGWSVLGLRFGLLILSFYPMEYFVLRVDGEFTSLAEWRRGFVSNYWHHVVLWWIANEKITVDIKSWLCWPPSCLHHEETHRSAQEAPYNYNKTIGNNTSLTPTVSKFLIL